MSARAITEFYQNHERRVHIAPDRTNALTIFPKKFMSAALTKARGDDSEILRLTKLYPPPAVELPVMIKKIDHPIKSYCRNTLALVAEYKNLDAAKAAGFDAAKIRRCVMGKAETHGDLIWKMADDVRPLIAAKNQHCSREKGSNSPRIAALIPKILSLYKQGMQKKVISRFLKIAINTVRTELKKAGL